MERFAVRALLLVISLLAVAFQPIEMNQFQNSRFALPESRITYTLKHPFHTVNGESEQVSSQLFIDHDKGIQQVSVSVPVRSFDSGNRARDRDMLDVTEADKYPKVTFVSSAIIERNGDLAVMGMLTFHGISREITFKARKFWEGEKLVVKGDFSISLDEFEIERPAILTIKVKDTLQVHFAMVY